MRGLEDQTNRRFGLRAALAVALLLLAALSTAARATQNVLENPEFSEALLTSGWTIYSGDLLDWTGQDATGCPNSGAAQLAGATTDTGTQWAELGQCQAIDPSAWTTGAHSAFSYFSFDATLAYAQFFYFTDTLCGYDGGTFLPGIDSREGPTGPGWHRVELSIASIPATAQSLFVAVGAEASQPTPLELLVDRAYFGQVPELFADDFEAPGAPCRWSASVP